MSFDKPYLRGKEHRKPYRGAKMSFASCRNHGSCRHCVRGRQHATERRKPIQEVHEQCMEDPDEVMKERSVSALQA